MHTYEIYVIYIIGLEVNSWWENLLGNAVSKRWP